MEQECDGHKTDDDDLFEQIALQRLYGILNQSGAVVSRDDLDSAWKRRLDLRKFLLHSIDYGESVHSIAHHNDSADGFSLAVPLRDSLANVGTERHGS